ncbi:MAG: U32 family peptidase [Oscillospiraceae bacterium]|nr:U32 family peptidase [Oscillospiraceae bacterium]
MNNGLAVPQLLSPAGDLESLDAAVMYGADAVYVGAREFSLRSPGLSDGELSTAVRKAREGGVKIYLACNAVPCNADADAFPRFVEKAADMGIDAVIVSDPGFFDIARSCRPALPVHISTQAGVANYAACNAWYKAGARRVILAREMTAREIRELREKTPPDLEIEVFVHGAMCVSFSGRCLLSAYMTGRDANKGMCSHPCRWEYSLAGAKAASLREKTRPDEDFELLEDGRGSYILNSKDLCVIGRVGELADAGVSSLKIEGRAKTAYYVAVITNAYRAALDALERGEGVPEWAMREVFCVSHRPYSTGFYFGEKGAQCHGNGGYIRECDFVGTVDGYADGALEVTQRGCFSEDDVIEAVVPRRAPERIRVKEMYDERGERIRVANRAMSKLRILCGRAYAAGTMIRRLNGGDVVFSKR